MGESNKSQWQSTFDELDLDLEESTAPEGRAGSWFQALAEFSRHSFARLLVSPGDDAVELRLEIALGAPDSSSDRLASALSEHLRSISKTRWDLTDDDTPWLLQTTIEAGDETHLSRALQALIDLSDHFESVDQARRWFEIIERPSSSGQTDRDEGDEPKSTVATPFEEIGAESPASEDATIEATAATRVNDAIYVAIGFSEVLAQRQIAALEEGLEHHLHTKFDVQARPTEADDRAELRMPASARTTLSLAVAPGGFTGSMGALETEINGFLERLEKFSSFGVDLFEYLGVGETVFDESADLAEDISTESQLSFRTRAPAEPSWRDEESDAEEGVVLDIGGPPATSSLQAKNYTDTRLQRDDADTPLVDIVLRHPGYSDRRIGQVLSILLSIDYHDAIDIADSAPCVIAWGLGQQRARSFKEVIESAGGKVLLVEPGTFGES